MKDSRELKVVATALPSDRLLVLFASGAGQVEIVVRPTGAMPRTDQVVMRGGQVVVLEGATQSGIPENAVTLAEVAMPSLTATVQQSQVTDLRAWR